MTTAFCIWIVTPPGYSHSRCFAEVALALREAFAALGVDAPIVTEAGAVRGIAIVLGANILAEWQTALPPQMILYNLEQIDAASTWITPSYLALLRRFSVWGYSARNIAALEKLGITARLCGIGYMPGLSRIASAPKDADVLFIGSINERRVRVLDAIAATGARVATGFDVYGARRDAMIARARIVLNLHYYEARVFEIVRVSYLLANRACVVSEEGADGDLEAPLKDGIAFASYENLAATCSRLLADETARAALAQRGFERMSALSQVAMLERALGR
jgi:hypothetical protein